MDLLKNKVKIRKIKFKAGLFRNIESFGKNFNISKKNSIFQIQPNYII